MERLWASWRSAYLAGLRRAGESDTSDTPGDDGPGVGGSIFERLLAAPDPDRETLIVWRGDTCFAVLNRFPYVSGHVLVLPKTARPGLADLTDAESTELWIGVRAAAAAVDTAYRPDGMNIGANLGAAAGAGVPDHLHVHVMPRWFGDTNFTTSTASTRVLSESLEQTFERVTAAWTAAGPA